jgi:hypothetical protein
MNISNHDLFVAVVGILLALVVFVPFSWLSRRAGSVVVEKWATTGGFQLVSLKRRTLVPFWRPLDSRRFQFFRVTVRDTAGVERKAWLRLESDCTEPEIIDVAWDDKKSSETPEMPF